MSQEVKRSGLVVAHTEDAERQLVKRSGVVVANKEDGVRQLVKRSGVLVAFRGNPDPVIHEFKNVESDLSGQTSLSATLHANNDVKANLSSQTSLFARLTMGADVSAHLSGASTLQATLDVNAPLEPDLFSGSSTLVASLSAGFEAELSGQTNLVADLDIIITKPDLLALVVSAGPATENKSWGTPTTALFVSAGRRGSQTSF